MWSEEEKLIETTIEEEKSNMAYGSLGVFCPSKSDGLQSLMQIFNF